MSKSQSIELANNLCNEFGYERASVIAWEMYHASALSRGEAAFIRRYIKQLVSMLQQEAA